MALMLDRAALLIGRPQHRVILLLIARIVGRSEFGLMAIKAADRWFISGVDALKKFTM